MDVQIDTSMMRIETDRLLLRPFEDGDLNDFYAYGNPMFFEDFLYQ